MADEIDPADKAKPVEAAGSPKGRKAVPSIFIVMTEAIEGREDEFNDWYTNIHCHDTMRIEGSVAVQRWKRSPYQLRYNAKYIGPVQQWLCIYEMNDTQANIDAHVRDCFTDAMPITSAMKMELGEDFYYVPVAPGKSAVETYNSRDGDVLLIRMNPLPGKEAEFGKWYREHYLPRTLALTGFVDGELYRVSELQLVEAVPTFAFTAVYHIADARSAIESLDSHLAQAGTILDCPLVDPDSIGIACYQAITNRFLATEARNLSPVRQRLEDQLRANMGDRRSMAEAVGGMKIKRDQLP
jgi:hypothetical protein